MSESDSDDPRAALEEEARGLSLLDLSLASPFHVFYTMQEHLELYETEAELLVKTKDFKATFGDVLNTSEDFLKKKQTFFGVLDAFVDRVFGGIRTCDGLRVLGLIEYMTETRDYFLENHKSALSTKSLSTIHERITTIDALLNLDKDGSVIPMTKAVASRLPTRFTSPYAVYLLDLVDRYACNFELTRTYSKMQDPDACDIERYGVIEIGGCPGGGAFLSNPPAVCWPCRDLRAAKIKMDETLVKKFTTPRRMRLRSIDVWLAKGRDTTCHKRRDSAHRRNSDPLVFAPRKVSRPHKEDGKHSHRRWRLRRPVNGALPSKPRRKRAADVVHTLHFQLEDLAYRYTMDKDQRVASSSLREKHCYNYTARPGSAPIETVYVLDSPTSLPKSARAARYLRRHKHVLSQDVY